METQYLSQLTIDRFAYIHIAILCSPYIIIEISKHVYIVI